MNNITTYQLLKPKLENIILITFTNESKREIIVCGIAGKFSIDRNIDEKDLLSMAEALEHRGPDGQGIWIHDNKTIGFAHRRLAIIDLTDSGFQPMHYLERYVITYNGEIYNYLELKKKFELQGLIFETASDTEVILAAYHLYGDKCVHHLDGMFAFAIFDKMTKELFCARDRFGEKPFYYTLDRKHFTFASEMKALWAIGIKKSISEKGIYQFLVHDKVDSRVSFYDGIHEIPPGHFLQVSLKENGLVTLLKRYYFLDENLKDSADILEIQNLLSRSTNTRSRADVKIATSLSGGIDSSIITALCSNHQGELNSFGISFPNHRWDESSKQILVSKKLGVKHHIYEISNEELLSMVREIIVHQELPISSLSIVAQNILYKFVASHGYKVLLEGQGADEVFGGYNYQHKNYIRELQKEGKLLSALKHLVYHMWNNRGKISEKINFKKAQKLPLNREFLESGEKTSQKSNWGNEFENGNFENLLRFSDRNAMMYGLEVRLPFLQHDLVQHGLNIAPDLKFKNGYKKWILRKAFDQIIPNEILWQREKIGFAAEWHPSENMRNELKVKTAANLFFDKNTMLNDNWLFKKMTLDILLEDF